MSRNKATVAALFRPPPPHCGNNKNLNVSERGLCDTPCAAVTSLYSALLTSRESKLHSVRHSSMTPSQWDLELSHTFLCWSFTVISVDPPTECCRNIGSPSGLLLSPVGNDVISSMEAHNVFQLQDPDRLSARCLLKTHLIAPFSPPNPSADLVQSIPANSQHTLITFVVFLTHRCVDLDEGDVRLLVHVFDFGVIGAAALQLHLYSVLVGHDVGVCHNLSIF